LIWRSPEELRGDSPILKSDIYSFGTLLWVIFSKGRSPCPPNLKPERWVEEMIKGKRLSLPSGVPEGVKNIVEKCWEDDPTDRPDFELITVRQSKRKWQK